MIEINAGVNMALRFYPVGFLELIHGEAGIAGHIINVFLHQTVVNAF